MEMEIKKFQLGTTGVEDVDKKQGKPNPPLLPPPSSLMLSHSFPSRGARILWGARGGSKRIGQCFPCVVVFRGRLVVVAAFGRVPGLQILALGLRQHNGIAGSLGCKAAAAVISDQVSARVG